MPTVRATNIPGQTVSGLGLLGRPLEELEDAERPCAVLEDPLWLPVRIPRLGAAAPRTASSRAPGTFGCDPAIWHKVQRLAVRASISAGQTGSRLGFLGQPLEELAGAPAVPRARPAPRLLPCSFPL